MKAYMGYSRQLGSEEGAVLIFAHNAKEAKRLAWESNVFDYGWYIDLVVRWLKNEPYLFKQMRLNIPHVIVFPKTCDKCKMWGTGEIGEDGICESCREND